MRNSSRDINEGAHGSRGGGEKCLCDPMTDLSHEMEGSSWRSRAS